MPIYDYVCQNCGHRMEVIHSVHGHGPSACPVCGGQMRKAFTPPAIHFKGTGWAKKERASSSTTPRHKRKEAGGEASGGGSSSGSSPDTSSESKSSSASTTSD